jgi:hypothetical protein
MPQHQGRESWKEAYLQRMPTQPYDPWDYKHQNLLELFVVDKLSEEFSTGVEHVTFGA